MEAISKQKRRHCPIHQSLTRPILLGGGDRRLVMTNITIIFALLFGVGIHFITVISAIFLLLVGQAIIVRLAKYDAHFVDIYLRHIQFKNFYLARVNVYTNSISPKPMGI